MDIGLCKQLMQIVLQGDLKEVTTLLLLQGCEVNYSDENGETPLMGAASKGHTAVVELLLEKEAKVDHRGWRTGYTALMRASKASSIGSVRALLKCGADPSVKNSNNETAFDLAGAFDAERTTDIQRMLYEELNKWVRSQFWEHTRFPVTIIELILEYHSPTFNQASEERAERLELKELVRLDHNRLLMVETEEERRKRQEESLRMDAQMQQNLAGLRAEWTQRGGRDPTAPQQPPQQGRHRGY